MHFYTPSYRKFRYFYNKASLLSANLYKSVSIYPDLAECLYDALVFISGKTIAHSDQYFDLVVLDCRLQQPPDRPGSRQGSAAFPAYWSFILIPDSPGGQGRYSLFHRLALWAGLQGAGPVQPHQPALHHLSRAENPAGSGTTGEY